MASITDIRSEDSGLAPGFGNVRQIEIEDAPLGSGGFGAVHACHSIDGSTPPVPLVVKIFHDGGNAASNHATVAALQERIRTADEGRRLRGEAPLGEVPGLKGLPLFSFTGELNGHIVQGYATYRLDTMGYVPFDTLTDSSDASARADYLSLIPDIRLQLAADLAEAFAVLGDELDFVHADLNAPNLWVNLTTGRLAVIDFDSGTVISAPGAQATTYGKLGDWLAPESTTQLAQGGLNAPVPVNPMTDAWAVMVGVSYLLFLCHPLVFLERLGTDALRSYFATYAWPDIQRSDPNFNRDNGLLYDWFCGQVSALPAPIREAFAVTLQEGTADPARRARPAQWREALAGQSAPPTVHLFEVDMASVPSGKAVELRWWVEGATEVSIQPGIGTVASASSCLVFPTADTTFTLTACGLFGSVTRTTAVQVVPQPPLPAIPLPPGTPAGGPATPFPVRLPGLRLHAPGLRMGLHIDLSVPVPQTLQGPGMPVRTTRHLTLTLPAFPWQALFRRLNAMSLHVR